jgi:hypothetical protein
LSWQRCTAGAQVAWIFTAVAGVDYNYLDALFARGKCPSRESGKH